MVEAANRAGGKDNVTVVMVEGERFTAPAVAPAGPVSRRDGWGTRALLFLGGLLVAGALGWLTRAMWQPAPVVLAPRTIAVTGTIAAAMAEARAGDTVEVPGGEYREQVQLKDGVTLQRAGAARAEALGGAVEQRSGGDGGGREGRAFDAASAFWRMRSGRSPRGFCCATRRWRSTMWK